MITFNQTANDDRYLITVIRINLDAGGVLYFSDTIDKITLDGIDFDGKVILQDSLSAITKDIDVVNGGSIGQVGNFSLGIARYNSYSGVSNFHEDFYPATNKPLLTSKTIEVGVVWSGATTLSQITWLDYYCMEDYQYNDTQMFLTCIAYDELTSVELPYYTIQNDSDNGISYYTESDEDTKGQIVPIIYGNALAGIDIINNKTTEFPVIQIGKTKKYIAASHVCYNVNGAYQFSLSKYLPSVKRYSSLGNGGLNITNTRDGLKFSHSPTVGDDLVQSVYLRPSLLNSEYTIDGGKAVDDNDTTYLTQLKTSTIIWKLESGLTASEFGQFTKDPLTIADDLQLIIEWQPVTGSSSVSVRFYDLLGNNWAGIEGLTTGTWNVSKFSFSIGVPTGSLTIDYLDTLNAYVLSGANDINIRSIYYRFNNLIVSRVAKTYFRKGATRRDLADGRIAKFYLTQQEFEASESPIFIGIKGYAYDSWVV